MEHVIELDQVSFAYEKEQTILSNLNLTIDAGESVGLIGANGTGKSTLLKILTGLLGHEGKAEVLGLEIEKNNYAEIRKKLGFVFQDSDSQLFMPTVYDDIAFAPRNYGMTAEEVEQRVEEALQRAEIPHLKYKQNYKMSGGEKRMACIAVVMAMKPEIILLDEPSITLDPYNRRTLIRNLNQMQETKLIASHDLDMIYETCERVILMDRSGIRADGPAEVILKDRELLEECHLELPFCFSTPVPKRAGTRI